MSFTELFRKYFYGGGDKSYSIIEYITGPCPHNFIINMYRKIDSENFLVEEPMRDFFKFIQDVLDI